MVNTVGWTGLNKPRQVTKYQGASNHDNATLYQWYYDFVSTVPIRYDVISMKVTNH